MTIVWGDTGPKDSGNGTGTNSNTPTQWDPNNPLPPGSTPLPGPPAIDQAGPKLPDGSSPINPPNVPKGKGGGSGTSVDTASMKQFAANLKQLVDPLNTSLNLLQQLKPVAAGGFYQGYNMRKMITGDSGEGMLVSGFETVLKKTIKSINDTHDAVLKLAADYKTTEEQNKIDPSKLTKLMSDVNTDIPAVGSAGSAFSQGSGSGQ